MTDSKTKLDPVKPESPAADTSKPSSKKDSNVVVTKLPSGSVLTNYVARKQK